MVSHTVQEDSSSNLFGYSYNIMDIITEHRLFFAGLGAAGVGLLLLRRWFAGGIVRSDTRLEGKVALVTGANCGIGLETAKELAARGAAVVLACRSAQRGAEAAARLREATGSCLIDADVLDLASLASVRDFAARFAAAHQRLDILVNNAGVMACPPSLTADGFETQLGVNHLGHFLLTCQLLPLLRRSPGARIVTVSSMAHSWGQMHWRNLQLHGEYTPFKAYAQSKLANVLFTRALAHRLRDDDVTAYCLHPGAVETNLARHQAFYFVALFKLVGWLTIKTAAQGAQTSLHCALMPGDQLQSGGYYSDCRLKRTAPQADSLEDAERLWRISEELVGIGAGGSGGVTVAASE